MKPDADDYSEPILAGEGASERYLRGLSVVQLYRQGREQEDL
jgi:hypothetical protein